MVGLGFVEVAGSTSNRYSQCLYEDTTHHVPNPTIGVMMKHFDPGFHLAQKGVTTFFFFIISQIFSQLCFPVSDLSVSAMFSQIWTPLKLG
ncbi:hypothetical protein E2542_SST14016 [Spatholobus suberectus]|nr:hypothetical protein E2542_SST14016 [Spatholobus suberectus]